MSATTDMLGYKIVDPWMNLHLPQCGLQVFTHSEQIMPIGLKFHTSEILRKGFTEQEHIAAMDRSGVERAVLTTYGQEFLEHPDVKLPTAEETIEFARRYHHRFIPAAGINSFRQLHTSKGIMNCVKKLEEWAKKGLKVLKVVPFATQIPPNDRIMYPLYAKCVELEIAVTINIGICAPLYGSAAVQNPLALDDICLDFPELVVIGAHMGHPWESLLIRLMEKYQNLYLMTSAYGPKYIVPEMINFMDGRGSHKVMFSADWPLGGFEKFIEQAVNIPLKDESRRNFLRENALRVFNWNWQFEERTHRFP